MRILKDRRDLIEEYACVRVCRDHIGGYPSWVQIGASTHTTFETVSDKYRTINGIAESRSTAMLAVGAASAAMNGSDVSYTLEPFSSLGPSAVRITKPDVVGVDGQPSTILATQEVATQVDDGTPISAASSDGRWPGTSQAAPHVVGLAALVIQMKRDELIANGTQTPTVQPESVTNLLRGSAVNIASSSQDPLKPNRLINNEWGHGFAMLPAPTPTPAPFGTLEAMPDEIGVGETTTVTAV